jgi:hypothetical protein
MDDKDKGMVEKTIEAVEEFVSEIKDAAKHMMDPPEPFQPGDELVMLPPMVDTGVLGVPAICSGSSPTESLREEGRKDSSQETRQEVGQNGCEESCKEGR